MARGKLIRESDYPHPVNGIVRDIRICICLCEGFIGSKTTGSHNKTIQWCVVCRLVRVYQIGCRVEARLGSDVRGCLRDNRAK
jgi:hypothetical protein